MTTTAAVQVTDPVCDMVISTEDSVGSVDHGGQTYHFCSPACLERFRSNPEAFLHAGSGAIALGRVAASPATPAEYTCPMHPEVVRSEPGACPICGMALEPRTVTAEESNPELDSMARRFWTSAALTSPLLVFMVADMFPGRPLHGLLSARAMSILQLALASLVVLWGGWP